MFSLPIFIFAVLASVAGVAHAKTDWSTITPDSIPNTTMVIFTVLATVVTIVQFLHCFAVVVGMEAGLGKRTFTVLFPGLVSLLALYILRAYFLTHYNHSPSHLSRAIYAMLYFTEQFSNILIAASAMAFLYSHERDWYEYTVLLAVRNGLRFLFLVAWLALVVANTIVYRPPSDVDHNALLTIALYQDTLTHAIIGFYNLITLDIAVSSFVLWIHARKYREPESDKDPASHINTLLFVTLLLAIRSLSLLVVHILSLVSIPPHLANTIWTVIVVLWLMADPTLCYAALYALLRASGVEPPIQFRLIVQLCLGIIFACFACVGKTVEAMPHTETKTEWVQQDNPIPLYMGDS
ncbi:hypothetical protein B0H12DRAFT_1077968 [Mycena haematopus]|nr:hypothetical protein B0H12DRAFT_1077968 [Mycena haematopus]